MCVYYMIKLIAVLIIYRYTLRCAIGSILAAVIAFICWSAIVRFGGDFFFNKNLIGRELATK